MTAMTATQLHANTARYAKCIEVSKRIRWDIDRDVIRGRKFDFSKKFLPDGLSLADQLDFLDAGERRLLSQVQGRTYANMFGLVERFISAKMLDISREHWLGDQAALEALVRFTDEEIKHQELFRRLERLIADEMAPGYRFLPQPNEVASFVLGKSTWAVLALTCHIEVFVLAHYRESVEPDAALSDLFKDVLLYHCRDEAQHAVLDELEWQREDRKLTPAERNLAVNELIELVAAVDGILQAQAPVDAEYFVASCKRRFTPEQIERVRAGILKAYRWQYIGSGVQEPRFTEMLGAMIAPEQSKRIAEALGPILVA
jgi:hypothetical protein